MKIHRDIEQNGPDWMILRSGKVTASNADALVTPLGKVKKGDGPRTFLMKMLAEAWIGGPLPSIQGVFDIDQGKILEEQAKPAFTLHTGIAVENVAFIESADGRAGCSPDGAIFDGERLVCGVEIKCPRMETHIRYLLDNELPEDYVAQVQFSMFITGLPSWHFFSYRRGFPPLHLEVKADPKLQDAFGHALADFYAEFDAAWKQLVTMNGGLPKSRGLAPLPPVQVEDKNGDIIP